MQTDENEPNIDYIMMNFYWRTEIWTEKSSNDLRHHERPFNRINRERKRKAKVANRTFDAIISIYT